MNNFLGVTNTNEEYGARFQIEVTIHTLTLLKCTIMVTVRSSHIPFKMHLVVFSAFKSSLYSHRRANSTDLSKHTLTDLVLESKPEKPVLINVL